MAFKNLDEVKKDILLKSKYALDLIQKKVYDVISDFLSEYYNEFSPEMYTRTEQLFRSLVKTKITKTTNGWIADVYFDLDSLDYSVKLLNGRLYNNTFHRQTWTHDNDAWVLSTAMEGFHPHGGYEGAGKETAIWIESLKVLNLEHINIFKKSLIDAGIPVK